MKSIKKLIKKNYLKIIIQTYKKLLLNNNNNNNNNNRNNNFNKGRVKSFSGIMKQKIQMENLSPAERGTMSCPGLIIIVLGCLIYARYFNAVSAHSVKTFH